MVTEMPISSRKKLVLFTILLLASCRIVLSNESANNDDDGDSTMEGDSELEEMDPLYAGDSVTELLNLCKNLKPSDFYTEEDSTKKICPEKSNCINHCTEDRVNRLRDAQTRVRNMLAHLTDFHRVFWHILLFLIVLCQGAYLMFVGQFNWRTLPVIGQKFEQDPTDGYRYGHYVWMRWVILDSTHPNYYGTMTPDTHELEYLPQTKDWEDEEGESSEDEQLHPAWSVRDICDMTADPNDRLEFYFRRVQLKYQLSKPPRHMRMYKQKQMKQKK